MSGENLLTLAWTRTALACAVVAWGSSACGLVGCGPGQPRPVDRERPPVLLISLDTVRADAVGAPGPDGASLTPHLDRLAADAVTFTEAVTPIPFTLPAHMTLLTGHQPTVHGVIGERRRLAAEVPTLTTLLAGHGYTAHGWVTTEWLEPEFGFGRGFDRYRRLRHGLEYAHRVTDAGLRSLRRVDGPLFLFLHYMDAHSDFASIRGNHLPYWAPPELRPPDLDEDSYCDAAGRCATAWLSAANREDRPVPEARLAELRRLYQAGIHHLDRELGRLFDGLRGAGLYRSALIVVTSDHGEEFREHGLFLHSQTYEESVRVPLLVKLPGNRMAGTASDAPATLADVLPTVLTVLDLPAPPGLGGRSLLPLPDHARDDATRGALPDDGALLQDKLRRSRWALRRGGYKLICDLESGAVELFDLARDPAERRDLAAAEPERVEAMRRDLERRLDDQSRWARRLGFQHHPEDDEAPADPVLGPRERARLRALGYL